MQNRRGVEVKQLQEILTELHHSIKICCPSQEEPKRCKWDYINAGNHKRILYNTRTRGKKNVKSLLDFSSLMVYSSTSGTSFWTGRRTARTMLFTLPSFLTKNIWKRRKGIKSLAMLHEFLKFNLGHWQWSPLSVQSAFKCSYFSFIPLGQTLHDKSND